MCSRFLEGNSCGVSFYGAFIVPPGAEMARREARAVVQVKRAPPVSSSEIENRAAGSRVAGRGAELYLAVGG